MTLFAFLCAYALVGFYTATRVFPSIYREGIGRWDGPADPSNYLFVGGSVALSFLFWPVAWLVGGCIRLGRWLSEGEPGRTQQQRFSDAEEEGRR